MQVDVAEGKGIEILARADISASGKSQTCVNLATFTDDKPHAVPGDGLEAQNLRGQLFVWLYAFCTTTSCASKFWSALSAKSRSSRAPASTGIAGMRVGIAAMGGDFSMWIQHQRAAYRAQKRVPWLR
jgi:hypothetical protein